MSRSAFRLTGRGGNPPRVLVVCTGNICRSPAAELLISYHEVFGPEAVIDSAGVGAVVDAPIDPPMRDVLDGLGTVDTSHHRGKQISPELLDEADLIVTMSTRQRSKILSLRPESIGRVFTLREFAYLRQSFGYAVDIETLNAHRSALPADLSLDIADPHRHGDAAMRIAVLDIIRALEVITNRPFVTDSLAVAPADKLIVMSSANSPGPETSSYMAELMETMVAQSELSYVPFSWRTALLGKVDVFHSHWPEAKLQAPSILKRWGRRFAFWWMTLNFARQKTAVVQTLHNLSPHEEQSGIDQRLINRLVRLETARIAINATTPHSGPVPTTTILHGHGRNSLSELHKSFPDPKQLAYFGLIREYKGVPELITVFRQLPSTLRLIVSGKPASRELTRAIIEASAADPRIDLRLSYLKEAELVDIITSSSLVLLPYKELHNSGAAILALSLNRPVLVPKNASTDALAQEVGEEWVIRFEGELTPEAIETALASAQGVQALGAPDLSLREWDLAGQQHAAVFAEAALRARTKRF